MKYMMAKVLYGAVGILLAAACICTGEKKLSQTDRQIYEKACSLEQDGNAWVFIFGTGDGNAWVFWFFCPGLQSSLL